jgi:protease I
MERENLDGLKVAILVADGFEEVELVKPRQALDQAGAKTTLVSPKEQTVRAWNLTDWSDDYPVDEPLEGTSPDCYSALLLPGGVINPDRLRIIPQAVLFVKSFFVVGKPVAAICHGPWTLIDAGIVSGRTVTSWPSLRTDLRNAGGTWVDREVVVDRNLVTSRKPDDIPAFNREVIRMFGRFRGANAA